MIPNRVLKEFAPELAPVIMDIYNRSLVEGYVLDLLKSSIVNPLPKSPLLKKLCKSNLRSITVTCTIAKVMEGLVRSRLITQIADNTDPCQYGTANGREGHSTADVLIYHLQSIHEPTDTGECAAKIFFANLSKGFDLISHNIFLKELLRFNVDPALVNLIKALLTNRSQAVRTGNFLSDLRFLKCGIPQGTKLGVILFKVMTNNLLKDWNLPRNGCSLLL